VGETLGFFSRKKAKKGREDLNSFLRVLRLFAAEREDFRRRDAT
jgi:hypothetical protein